DPGRPGRWGFRRARDRRGRDRRSAAAGFPRTRRGALMRIDPGPVFRRPMFIPPHRGEGSPTRPLEVGMQFQITFDAADPRRLSLFWAKALGYAHPWPPGHDLFATESPFEAWDSYFTEIGIPEDQHNIASAIEDPEGDRPRIFF